MRECALVVQDEGQDTTHGSETEEDHLQAEETQDNRSLSIDSQQQLLPSEGVRQPVSASLSFRVLPPVLLAAVSMAMLALTYLRYPSMATSPPKTARQLLESPAFVDLTTAQMLEMGGPGRDSDRPNAADLRQAIQEGIQQYIEDMKKAPPGEKALEDPVLSDEKRLAVFQMMQHLNDPRLRALGLQVSGVIRVHKNESKEVIQHHIAKELRVNSEQVESLRHDIIPVALHPPPGSKSSGHWDMLFSDDKIRLLATFQDSTGPGHWDMDLRVAEPKIRNFNSSVAQLRRLLESEKVEAAGAARQVFIWMAAALMQTELIDKILLKSFGLEVPGWLEGITTFGIASNNIVDCSLDPNENAADLVFCLILNTFAAVVGILDFFI